MSEQVLNIPEGDITCVTRRYIKGLLGEMTNDGRTLFTVNKII